MWARSLGEGVNPLLGLVERWRGEADAYARDGVPGHAALLRRVADELEAAWRTWWTEGLSIAQAVIESGYSEDRLRELVREGKLPDARPVGSRGEMRIRRCDLPRRPSAAPAASAVEALATQVLAGRR